MPRSSRSPDRRRRSSRSPDRGRRSSYSRSPSRSSSRSPSRRPRSFSRSPSRRRHFRSPDRRRRPLFSRSPDRRRRRPSYSRSPEDRRRRSISRSRSPDRRRRRSADRRPCRRPRYEWGGEQPEKNERRKPPAKVEKEQPNFGLSGKLAQETNTVKGVELKYNEPPEAAKPRQKWRLYVFKGSEQIDLLHIHRQSAYLIGRDRTVAEIPVDHPSCSKQHAVLQFRQVMENDPDTGKPQPKVKPYIIDLESTNGTFLNGEQIPSTRFIELRIKDVLKFGHSTREYVLLHSEATAEEE